MSPFRSCSWQRHSPWRLNPHDTVQPHLGPATWPRSTQVLPETLDSGLLPQLGPRHPPKPLQNTEGNKPNHELRVLELSFSRIPAPQHFFSHPSSRNFRPDFLLGHLAVG